MKSFMTQAQQKRLGLRYTKDTKFPDVQMFEVISIGIEIGLSKHSDIPHDIYRYIDSQSKGIGFADGINYERMLNKKKIKK